MFKTIGDSGIYMYNLVGALGYIAVLVYYFILFRSKRDLLSNCSLFFIKIASKKNKDSIFTKINFWTTIEILVITCMQILPISILNQWFGKIMNTGGNYFGIIYFVPLILFLLFSIISINPFKQMDLITPGYALILVFAKMACFCDGCCGGFECSWGLANYHYSSVPKMEFPSQLVEAGLALAIFIFLHIYRKKAKEGTLFPIYVITYSATRFFSEFTRNDPNIFGILKLYHILCIIGVILGTIELILVIKYSKKLTPIFEHTVFALDKKKVRKKSKQKK